MRSAAIVLPSAAPRTIAAAPQAVCFATRTNRAASGLRAGALLQATPELI